MAILLSGGVDSSLMVLAAGRSGRKPVALTTITQRTAELEREIVYARQAAERLQAEHRFVEAGRTDYAEALIETIKVLGQPPHHESTVNGLVSSRELARQEPGLGLLLHGQGADALQGLNVAAGIQYAERCPAWSLPVLRLAANLLARVAPTKASGAHAAAAMLNALRTPESHLHPANAQAAYTDWAAMEQAFGCRALREAMGYRRAWAARYADAETVTEQVQMIDLLSDAWDTACLTRQVGLAHGREIAFPFLDEAVVSASLAFNPRVRFAAGRRTKPVLKAALAAGTSRAFADRPKLSGGFPSALFEEMRSGSLADLVRSIKRPGFVSRELFEQKKERPDWFTWNLLTFDLWEKLVLTGQRDIAVCHRPLIFRQSMILAAACVNGAVEYPAVHSARIGPGNRDPVSMTRRPGAWAGLRPSRASARQDAVRKTVYGKSVIRLASDNDQ